MSAEQEKQDKIYKAINKFAETSGFHLNPDKELVYDLIRGLLENEKRYGYRSCPCRLATGVADEDKDILCPCFKYMNDDLKEFGSCYCWLYVTDDYVTGKIPHVAVPDRRPPIF